MRTRLVSVAGSDSGGGAGLQADLRAAYTLDAHAATVVTAVTAQDGRRVHASWPVPASLVRCQLEAALDDPGADAVKTGMLCSADVVGQVAACLAARWAPSPLVVDPVILSSGGDPLLEPAGVQVLRDALLPLATVVTPNLAEVRALTGHDVRGPGDLASAAAAVLALGPRWVVVTGGHLEGDPVDLVTDGRTTVRLPGTRIATVHDHGTGCTFSSALAVWLGRGLDVPSAARRAKELVERGLVAAGPVGAGRGPVWPGRT